MTAWRLALQAWFVDLLLPRRCVSCGGPSPALCSSCRASLRPIQAPLCARCGAPTSWPVERCRECAGRRLAFSSARSAVAYAGPAPALIRAWKERGLRHLAATAAEIVATYVECPAVDAITAIPPDAIRQLGRGGRHPSEALVEELARVWSLEPRRLLARARPAQRQTALPFDARRANVRDAFVARGQVPRRVLVVDDVYTTGATGSAAATALRAAGATHVWVITLARAVR